MKIAIHVNLTREHAYDVAVAVCRVLRNLQAEILMSSEFRSYFEDFDICFCEYL